MEETSPKEIKEHQQKAQEMEEFLAEVRAKRDRVYKENKETLINSHDFRHLVKTIEFLSLDLGDYLVEYDSPVVERDILDSFKKILEIFHEDFSTELEKFEENYTEEDRRWQRKNL